MTAPRWKCRTLSRRRRQAALLAAVFCVAALALSCTFTRDAAAERERLARDGSGELVIAAPWPWALRKEIRYGEGLLLAIEEVNAAGGIRGRRLRLAQYDDEESIDRGRVVARRIAAAPEVVAVIGHLQSYITVQTATTYDQAGLVMLAPTATDSDLTSRGYSRVFRICFTDRLVGRQLADLAGARGWKRLAIYYIRNSYGRNIANAFEARAAQLGLDVRARSSYDPSEQANERTFGQTIDEWAGMELDAILLAGEVPSAAIFVAQARKEGITVPILGGDAMSSPGLMAVAGAASEGVIVASYFHPDEPRPEVARFISAFHTRYGVAPDAGSALGYDCIRLLAHAMLDATSPAPDAIAKALHGVVGWRGVTGAFTFDARGDPTEKTVTLSIVRNGSFDYLPHTPVGSAGGAP